MNRATTLPLILMLTLALRAAPPAVEAQPAKIPRIEVAFFGSPGASCVEAFRQRLRDASYVEGQTLEADLRKDSA